MDRYIDARPARGAFGAAAHFSDVASRQETARPMLISPAYAQAATPAASNPLFQLIPFILVFVFFYFLIIRPQSQARKKHQEMIANVKRGDVVVTSGGMVGKITKVLEGDEVMVELADNVIVKVVKSTLVDIRNKPAPAANDQ
jgi:preprotein translocase subunit YajC